jgi:hypothetical protein
MIRYVLPAIFIMPPFMGEVDKSRLMFNRISIRIDHTRIVQNDILFAIFTTGVDAVIQASFLWGGHLAWK